MRINRLSMTRCIVVFGIACICYLGFLADDAYRNRQFKRFQREEAEKSHEQYMDELSRSVELRIEDGTDDL